MFCICMNELNTLTLCLDCDLMACPCYEWSDFTTANLYSHTLFTLEVVNNGQAEFDISPYAIEPD